MISEGIRRFQKLSGGVPESARRFQVVSLCLWELQGVSRNISGVFQEIITFQGYFKLCFKSILGGFMGVSRSLRGIPWGLRELQVCFSGF